MVVEKPLTVTPALQGVSVTVPSHCWGRPVGPRGGETPQALAFGAVARPRMTSDPHPASKGRTTANIVRIAHPGKPNDRSSIRHHQGQPSMKWLPPRLPTWAI